MTKMLDFSKNTLFDVGNEISDELFVQIESDSAYLFKNPECIETDTNGWAIEIGGASEDELILELWLDSYANLKGNRFYAGFRSNNRGPIKLLKDSASASWKPKHTIRSNDVQYGSLIRLKHPLDPKYYGKSIHELHANGETYLGFYDPIDPADKIARQRFVRHAVNFFLDMLRTRFPTDQLLISPDEFPKATERRVVRTHLVHERNRSLANQCKRRDDFRCQVCNFKYSEFYGQLGDLFAESHHIVPLSKLEDGMQTNLSDLITVCANCHRMLHHMNGELDDIKRLRSLVRTQNP